MTSWFCIISLLLSSAFPVWAEAASPVGDTTSTASNLDDTRLPFWSIITDIPETSWVGLKSAFSQDAIPGWALVIGSTAVLYHYDEDILNSVQSQGRSWDLGNSVDYKSVLKVGGVTLWSAPTDTAGWLYFMGDGTIPIVLSVGMIGGGYLGSDSHIYNTGIEMADGLLTGSIFDQIIKHMAGRQSPSQATQPRGDWHPFANLKEYQNNTSAYDAMASGHIMTATVMFTVIEQEYSDYNYVFYPLEAAWLGTLAFGMVNVGVHWASDYPLGIAMGYIFGKSAVDIHHPDRNKKTASTLRFFPGMDPATGTQTMNAQYTF
jgi:hypothetical protein